MYGHNAVGPVPLYSTVHRETAREIQLVRPYLSCYQLVYTISTDASQLATYNILATNSTIRADQMLIVRVLKSEWKHTWRFIMLGEAAQ